MNEDEKEYQDYLEYLDYQKKSSASTPGSVEKPDERGAVMTGLQAVGKGLDDLSGAAPLKALLARALGTHSTGEVTDMLNPMNQTQIPYRDVLKKAGVPEGMKVGGMDPTGTGQPLKERLKRINGFDPMPTEEQMSMRDIAGDVGDMLSPAMVMGSAQKAVSGLASKFPGLAKLISKPAIAANGVQGVSTMENVMNPLNKFDELRKNLQVSRADSKLQDAFKWPQKRIDTAVNFDKSGMTPLWQQAKEAGFSGTMEDFMALLDKNRGDASRAIGEVYKANPNASVNQEPILKLLDSKADEFSTSLVPGMRSEGSPIRKQTSNLRKRLEERGQNQTVPTYRKDPLTGEPIQTSSEVLNTPATTLPLEESVRFYRDTNDGIRYNKPIDVPDSPSEKVFKQTVRVTKDEIKKALPTDDFDKLMESNKKLYSSDENVQKTIAPFARLKSEDPEMFTGVDRLYSAHGPLTDFVEGHPIKALTKTAGLVAKKSRDFQKSTAYTTGQAQDLFKAGQTPVNATDNMVKQAALIQYLESLNQTEKK